MYGIPTVVSKAGQRKRKKKMREREKEERQSCPTSFAIIDAQQRRISMDEYLFAIYRFARASVILYLPYDSSQNMAGSRARIVRKRRLKRREIVNEFGVEKQTRANIFY